MWQSSKKGVPYSAVFPAANTRKDKDTAAVQATDKKKAILFLKP
jgi:hypothetical protein